MLYLLLSLTTAKGGIVCHKDFKNAPAHQCNEQSLNFCQFDHMEGTCKAKCHMFQGLANMQSACDKQDGCFFKGKENLCLQTCDSFHDQEHACNYQFHCKYDQSSGKCTRDKKKKKNLRPKSDPCLAPRFDSQSACAKEGRSLGCKWYGRLNNGKGGCVLQGGPNDPKNKSAGRPECRQFSNNWSTCSLLSEYCFFDWNLKTCAPDCKTIRDPQTCKNQQDKCFWHGQQNSCLPQCGSFSNNRLACQRNPQCAWSAQKHQCHNKSQWDGVIQPRGKKDVTVCHKDYQNDFWGCYHDSLCNYDWSDNVCRPQCDQLHGQQSACDKQHGHCFYKGKENMCLQKCDTIRYSSTCDREFHCTWKQGKCQRDKKKSAQRWAPAGGNQKKGKEASLVTVCHKHYANDFWGCAFDRQCEWKQNQCRARCETFKGMQSACDKQQACHFRGKDQQCAWNCDTYRSWFGCTFTAEHCFWNSMRQQCEKK